MNRSKTIVGMTAVREAPQPTWALQMSRKMNNDLRAEVNRLNAALSRALTENHNLRLVIAHHGIEAFSDLEVEYVD